MGLTARQLPSLGASGYAGGIGGTGRRRIIRYDAYLWAVARALRKYSRHGPARLLIAGSGRKFEYF